MTLCTLLTCLLAVFNAAAADGPGSTLEGSLPGLQWRLEIPHPAPDRDAAIALRTAGSGLSRQWELLARNGSASDLAKVNDEAGHRSARMQPLAFDALMRVMDLKERSRGAVDPLAGPLHDWWGQRQGRLPGHWPSAAELDSLAALVRRGGIYVVDLGVLLRDKGMALDLDPCLPALLADGVVDSLRAAGQAPWVQVGDVWRNASSTVWNLSLPRTEACAGATLPLTGALALVRGVERGRVDGKPVSDLIDARSGLPVTGVEAWALAPTALEAWAWARTLALVGEEALALPAAGTVHMALARQSAAGSWQWTASPSFPLQVFKAGEAGR